MRLTLRTLLAYLDDVLTPADREDLRHRIEASEFASDLIHRTSDTMRRIRLGAPEVLGEGVGSDPNTVAEYLDNTMAPEVVPEFERVCLERNSQRADAQLAEAAACHHILTMVLGQPVEIDTPARQRMYAMLEVAHRNEEAARAAAVAPIRPAKARPADDAEEPIRHTPDYLRTPDRPLLLRLAPAIAAVLLLSAVSWLAFRPQGPLGWMLAKNDAAAEQGDPMENPEPAPNPSEPLGGVGEEDLDDADLSDVTPGGEEAGPDAVGAPGGDAPAPVESTTPPTPEEAPLEPTIPPEEVTDTPEVDPVPARNDGAGAETTPPSDTVPPSETMPPSVELPAGETIQPPPVPAPTAPEVDPETPTAPSPPREIGRTLPSDQVLLRLDPTDDSWIRIPGKLPLMAGDHLLALPTYRPAINLDSTFDIELLGGTRAVIDQADGMPVFQVIYGRVVLTNVSKQDADLRLEAGDASLDVRVGVGGTLAVETYRPFRPGLDPIVQPAPAETYIFARAAGAPIEWTAESGPARVEPDSEAGWLLRGGEVTPSTLVTLPLWAVSRELASPLDVTASPRLAKQLVEGEPAWPKLLSAFGSRFKDERYLAAVSSMHVGNFEPFVTSLRDPEQKLAWDSEILAMRIFMSRSQSLANSVRDELINQCGPDQGVVLYEMLVGYTPEQIGLDADSRRSGKLKELIDRLESDRLDFRVLAANNIEEITGHNVGFPPAGPAQNRDRYIRSLRSRLDSDTLIQEPIDAVGAGP